MVTMNQGIKEMRDTSSRFIHNFESGVLAVYGWMSGPAMTDQERVQIQMAESEVYRRFSWPSV